MKKAKKKVVKVLKNVKMITIALDDKAQKKLAKLCKQYKLKKAPMIRQLINEAK